MNDRDRAITCTKPSEIERTVRIMRNTCAGIEPHFQQKYIRKIRKPVMKRYSNDPAHTVEDKNGEWVKHEDADFERQMLELDKRQLIEALQRLSHACDIMTKVGPCNDSAKLTLKRHQYCYMCQAKEPKAKAKEWVKETHGGRVFCCNACINNYANGADIT